MIKANLLHLGTNMWREESVTELNFDEPTWREIAAAMPAAGFNMVVVDLGEGVVHLAALDHLAPLADLQGAAADGHHPPRRQARTRPDRGPPRARARSSPAGRRRLLTGTRRSTR